MVHAWHSSSEKVVLVSNEHCGVPSSIRAKKTDVERGREGGRPSQ